MQNQNQFQNAGPPPPPMMNMNMNMNQPQNLDPQLPNHANGMRKSARTCAFFELIMSILSFLIGFITVYFYVNAKKKGDDAALVYNCLLPILEFTASIIHLCGTNWDVAAPNPVGSLSKTVTWLMMSIMIMYARYFFVNVRVYIRFFQNIDDLYLLYTWYAMNLGFHIIYFGVSVTYARAIYEVSRDRSVMTVTPGPMPMMSLQPPPNWGPPPGPMPNAIKQ